MVKVFYHKNCYDGIASAWVLHTVYSGAEFYPINYGEKFPYESLNSHDSVFLVDFSLSRTDLERLKSLVKNLQVIDHHKSAEIELRSLPYCIFNMKESGASLAWRYFYGHHNIPTYIQYVRDRDLWLHELPHSEAINAFIQSFDKTIKNCYDIHEALRDRFDDCLIAGKSVLRYKASQVNEIASQARIMNIAGYEVPVVNTSALFSEVPDKILSDNPDIPFAAYYYDRADKRQWGLRSRGEFDVSEIAKKFGGGGHKNAAGFVENLKES